MKKIAFIHSDFPTGGADRVTMDIANYLLLRPDYEFFVFTLRLYPQKMLPVIDDSRFHIHVLPSGENDLTDGCAGAAHADAAEHPAIGQYQICLHSYLLIKIRNKK